MFRAVVLIPTYILITISVILGQDALDYLDITIQQGVVRGYKDATKDYFAFLGIPYASAPIGENRFKAPLPPPNWTGVFYANRTVICAQLEVTNEDCLVVNIYVPINIVNQSQSVLVYIHGGGFLFGSGTEITNFSNFIQQNVIVVTINYRLGALGFLCLRTEDVPGNAGMKDQVAALKWIKNNIKYFGGNERSITVAGTSVGAASVELLILSPLAKGLFNHAIVESGSATSVWTINQEPVKTAKDIASKLGYQSNKSTMDNLYAFYKNIDVQILNSRIIMDFVNRTDGSIGFAPCIEKESKGAAFISKDPLDLILAGQFQNVSILYIFTNGEGFQRMPYLGVDLMTINQDFSQFLPANLYFKTPNLKYEVANKTKHFYFGNRNISGDTLPEYVNYFGDMLFTYSIVNTSRSIAQANSKQVFLLEFTYEGSLNGPKQYKNISGASHGDSHFYVFSKSLDNVINAVEQNVVNTMVGIWINFIKTGSPSIQDWLPLTYTNITYLQVGDKNIIMINPYPERIDYWNNIYAKYRRNLTDMMADSAVISTPAKILIACLITVLVFHY